MWLIEEVSPDPFCHLKGHTKCMLAFVARILRETYRVMSKVLRRERMALKDRVPSQHRF